MKKGKRSPKPSNGGSMNSIVRANIEITQADLLTVAVSRAETQLQNQLEESKARVSAIESEKNSIGEQAKTMVNEHVDNLFSEQIKQLNEAIAAIGGNKCVKTDWSFCSRVHSPSFWNASDIRIIIQIASGRTHGTAALHEVVIPITDVVHFSSLQSRFNDLKSELEAEQQKAIGIRRKLANIPMLERRFRATLIENQLATTTEGRDLLESIGLDVRHVAGTIEDAIKALPSV